jgi:hypothetical protein
MLRRSQPVSASVKVGAARAWQCSASQTNSRECERLWNRTPCALRFLALRPRLPRCASDGANHSRLGLALRRPACVLRWLPCLRGRTVDCVLCLSALAMLDCSARTRTCNACRSGQTRYGNRPCPAWRSCCAEGALFLPRPVLRDGPVGRDKRRMRDNVARSQLLAVRTRSRSEQAGHSRRCG